MTFLSYYYIQITGHVNRHVSCLPRVPVSASPNLNIPRVSQEILILSHPLEDLSEMKAVDRKRHGKGREPGSAKHAPQK